MYLLGDSPLISILTQLGTLLGFQVNLLGGFQVRLKYYGTLYITNDIWVENISIIFFTLNSPRSLKRVSKSSY